MVGVAARMYQKEDGSVDTDNKVLKICVERNKGYNFIYDLDIFADESRFEDNYQIVERLIKTILWVAGGYKVYIAGDDYLFDRIYADYTMEGARAFDVKFMSGVYEKPFEVVKATFETIPEKKSCSLKVGGPLDGCRIGFDAGGSDRKVSAVIDGKVVYSEEVVWFPKTNSDYNYHYNGIKIFNSMGEKLSKFDETQIEELDSKSFVIYMTQFRDAFTHLVNIYLTDIMLNKDYVLEQLERVNGHLERIVIDSYRKICDRFIWAIRKTKKWKDVSNYELQIAQKIKALRMCEENISFEQKKDGFYNLIVYMEAILNKE